MQSVKPGVEAGSDLDEEKMNACDVTPSPN